MLISISAVRIVKNHAEYAVERDNKIVWRRYRDFENLRKSLLLTNPHVPQLPKKYSWWASRSPDVVNSRKVELEEFLQKIIRAGISEENKIAWESFFQDDEAEEEDKDQGSSYNDLFSSFEERLKKMDSSDQMKQLETELERVKLENIQVKQRMEDTDNSFDSISRSFEKEKELSSLLKKRIEELEARLASRGRSHSHDSLPSLESTEDTVQPTPLVNQPSSPVLAKDALSTEHANQGPDIQKPDDSMVEEKVAQGSQDNPEPLTVKLISEKPTEGISEKSTGTSGYANQVTLKDGDSPEEKQEQSRKPEVSFCEDSLSKEDSFFYKDHSFAKLENESMFDEASRIQVLQDEEPTSRIPTSGLEYMNAQSVFQSLLDETSSDLDLPVIAELLKLNFNTNPNVAELGCDLVTRLCYPNPSVCGTLGDLGVCKTIIHLMARYPQNENIAIKGCAAICNLAFHDQNAQEFQDFGAFDVILNCLDSFVTNQDVVQHALAASMNLLIDKQRTAEFGMQGHHIIAKVFKYWADKKQDVARECCILIRNLVTDAQVAEKIGFLCSSPIIKMLKAWKEDRSTTLELFLLTRNLAIHPRNREILVRISPMLVSAFAFWKNDEMLSLYGCLALRNLSSKNLVAIRTLGELGCCEVVASVIRESKKRDHAYAVCALIMNLSFNDMNSNELIFLKVTKELVQCLKQWGNDEKMSLVCCGATYGLLFHATNKKRALKDAIDCGILEPLSLCVQNENQLALLQLIKDADLVNFMKH